MDSRLAIGVTHDSRWREVRAALVRVHGIGLECRVESVASVAASCAVPFPPDVARPMHEMIEAIRAVAARAEVSLDEVLVLGVHADTDDDAAENAAWVSARLAELTGTTTVAGLSARDRASGGCGRPTGTVCDWIAANDARRSRFVLHLDDSSSLSHIPARCGPAAVRSMETGPGIELLDSLAAALTQGRQPGDPRGMLAVQGRQIKPLIRRWATHPFLQQDSSRRLHPDDFSDAFVRETLEMTVERGWSVFDVLCTATHFVAACPADAVRQHLAKDCPADDVVLVGRGTQNGFLLRLVEEQFSGLGISTAPLPTIAPDAYGAVAAAVLACLTLDGVPANLPAITGAAGPRLLGHLTPGTSRNWHACVEWMHRTVRPAVLRVA